MTGNQCAVPVPKSVRCSGPEKATSHSWLFQIEAFSLVSWALSTIPQCCPGHDSTCLWPSLNHHIMRSSALFWQRPLASLPRAAGATAGGEPQHQVRGCTSQEKRQDWQQISFHLYFRTSPNKDCFEQSSSCFERDKKETREQSFNCFERDTLAGRKV